MVPSAAEGADITMRTLITGITGRVGRRLAAHLLRRGHHVRGLALPSDIDAGWTDPESFQTLIEQRLWEQLDREETLRAVATTREPGETEMLGTVTLRPDGTVVDSALDTPAED